MSQWMLLSSRSRLTPLQWCGLGGFASYTNAMIKYLESKVSIAFRTRLTRYIHDLYLNNNLNYYKLSNLDGGVGQGADQFITQDLTLFCAAAANIYSSLGKPFVDLCVFNYQLFRSLGPLASFGLLSNYILTANILRRLSPPFGKLKAVEGRKEGDFRSLHARLIANAEEVAFYGGADMEKQFLNREFKSLKNWMEGIYMLKIRYNMLEDFVLKYSWSAYGYLLSALPVFLPAWGGLGGKLEMAENAGKGSRERGRMREFITNKRLMLSLADAGGRMMYSIKDLSELAGYTSRVYTLISTLHRVHADAYYLRGQQNELYSLSDVQGTIQKGFDGVRLEGVPVVAPGLWPRGGEELVESLSLVIRRGEHLLVCLPCYSLFVPANMPPRSPALTAWASRPSPASSRVCGRYTAVSSVAPRTSARTASCSCRRGLTSASARCATRSSTPTATTT
jgi:ATP-binding cassette subfamily D (ALD) long-chain fatty acid import protein